MSYQQALGFSDELYRYYLTHKIYSDEEVVALVKKGLVTEEEYLGIQLWYFNGNAAGNWLGPPRDRWHRRDLWIDAPLPQTGAN